jgi:hypothetical protein
MDGPLLRRLIMVNDRSPLWLQEIQIAMDRRYIDRLDRAIDELQRLGWECRCFKAPTGGPPQHISITLYKTMEFDLCP